MTVYSLVLFLHVLSAIALFIAFALEGFVSLRIGLARDQSEMRFFVRASDRLKWIGIPAFAGLILGGLYLARPFGSGAFWIPAALVATLGIMALGGFITGRRRSQLAKALAAPDPDIAKLAERARSTSVATSYGLRVGLAVGIVWLMTARPGTWPALAALAAGLAGGLLLAKGWQRIARAGAGGGCAIQGRPWARGKA